MMNYETVQSKYQAEGNYMW